jgi:hypothetical protein
MPESVAAIKSARENVAVGGSRSGREMDFTARMRPLVPAVTPSAALPPAGAGR